jgi:hypothetical protein
MRTVLHPPQEGTDEREEERQEQAKSKPAGKRGLKDLSPKRTNDAKGGTKIMANAHEMKKALIGNIPR